MGDNATNGQRPAFHHEPVHRRRALGALPFATSPDLATLIDACYPPKEISDAAPPATNPYALQFDTLQFLSAILARVAPERIVEFGSGESTRLLAAWAADHQAHVLSIEHDRGWAQEIGQRLTAPQQAAVTLVQAPLRPHWRSGRQFLTYRGLADFAPEVQRAGLIFIDGPHVSGREPVLYLALAHCQPDALIIVDDYRNYGIRESLLNVPPEVAAGFVAQPIADNSHGLCVLRCVRRVPKVRVPWLGPAAILRSYWRCLRDLRQYGTGDFWSDPRR